MSYVVLARKYRPPNFDSLVGQEHVVQALTNALTQQRLHHAYLFTGTRGVGKTTISRILAKSLNCTGSDGAGGITAQPCGQCESCRDIDAGRFIDYVELDAASNRGVDEISQLLDQAVYKPVLGRFKVYMIDEVHMLSTTAFNAMLKTLEEPPEYLKFVLATTDPQKVPVTVLSRCLQFNLRPMTPQAVQEHLAAVLGQEHIQAELGALRLVARAARGSMRDALSLTDQAIAYGAGQLLEKSVREMLGAVDRGHAVRIVEAVAASDGAALVAAADGLRALGLSARGALEEMCTLLQQMAVSQVVSQEAGADATEASEAARVSGLIASDETQLLYSIALHGRAELELAPDEYSGLVMVLLRMLAFRPRGESVQVAKPSSPAKAERVVPASERAASATGAARGAHGDAVSDSVSDTRSATPVRLEDAAPSRPAEPAAAVSAPAPRSTPESRETSQRDRWNPGEAPGSPEALPMQGSSALNERWATLVGGLADAGLVSALARELAMQSQCVALDEESEPIVCCLRVERENLRAQALCEKLQSALSESLGRPVRLVLEAGALEDSPAKRDAAEHARRQAQAEQIIHDDPLVRALMAQFKTARIVPGSVKPH